MQYTTNIASTEQPLAQFMVSRAEDNGFALYEFIKALTLAKHIEQKLLRHLTGFGYDAFAIYAYQQRPESKEEQQVFAQLRQFINNQELPSIFSDNIT